MSSIIKGLVDNKHIVNELFNTEPLELEWDGYGDQQTAKAMIPARLGEYLNTPMDVNFFEYDEDAAEVGFRVGGRHEITGQGQNIKGVIFATAIRAIQEYLMEMPHITKLVFSAKELSRARMYDSLSKRYASKYGWHVVPPSEFYKEEYKDLVDPSSGEYYFIIEKGVSPKNRKSAQTPHHGKFQSLQNEPVVEDTGMDWEEKLMDVWAPVAAKHMAKVVKQAFNSLYPDVKLKVWAEAEGVSATTDLTSDDVKADVFGQYGKKDWECNFFCGPLYNEADDRKYLELMVDDAASGSYPGVWKIIVSEWKNWASSQLKKTNADDVCFSVNEDMSGGAWKKIAKAVGIKFIAHDLDEGVAEGQGKQMSKTKALNALRKELMNSYEFMKCSNLEEFKQRLQWLSEGMLKNHMTGGKTTAINMEEIELYKEYREKRDQIKQGSASQGMTESNRLYKYHQKLRKQAGLPDPQEYLRMQKQKLIELILLNDPNQELNVLELATIPELQEIYQMVQKVDEDNTYQFAAEKTPPVSPYAGVKDNQFRGAIGEGIRSMFEEPNQSPTDAGYQQGGWRKMNEEEVSEDLRKWFKEKWVRFGPDGKIRGACARGSKGEGKPKCLPQSKAHSLGKKGRASAAAKKRREDPNPERSGPAKNVATKKKSKSESINEGLWDLIKDKLSNKKPIQWSENYYDFIIRNDPLYLQTYLNAVKNDPNYIEWKKNNPNKPQQSTSQTNYASSQNRPNQSGSFDDFTAPHGSSENEFKMFVNGQKPAAIVPEPNFSTWAKVINSGKYWTKQLFYNGRLHSVIIVQPGNEQSGQQIYELVQNAMKLAEKGDFRAYNNSNYHRRLGKLLGYPKDKVEQFINNYFKDREDLAKIKIDEQGVTEDATVTRIDSKPITDFSSGLKAYKHTDDWSQSGLETGDDSYWKNKNLKTNTTKGLFAGDPHRTALYATGNAHETRYVEFTQNGQPIVYFDKKDLPAIRSRETYLTVFDASNFKKLPTGEWFSENPGKPIKQTPIGDPFKYIADQGWIIRVTDDLNKVFNQVQKMHKAGKIDHYGAEGMNESKSGVAEGFPQPGESSGKAKQFNPNAKIQTKEMTLDQVLNTVKGIPYVNNVIDDWDAKDYSWGVTKKVIEYAQYLKKNPQSVANLPPLVVIDGQLNDGAHRLSAINLLQKRMDPKNPLWKQVKLKVNFGTSADVASEQGVAEGFFMGNVKDTELKNIDPDNYNKGEGDFVKNQLHTIKRVVTHLENSIGSEEDLPDWVQSEIAKATDKIVNVMDYSISKKEQDIGSDSLMKEQGVAEGYSDMSGLLSASNLNNSYIITAELAEGGKKKFRVKAQSERVAIEKFKKHHSMAKIINVEEEGVKEGSKYPRNPASYHLKKYPVPQDQMAKPVKKEPKKPEQKPEEKVDEGKRIPRKPGQPANSKKHSDLYTDENPKGTIHGLKFATAEDARASVSKIRNSGRSHAHKIQAAVAMEQRAKAAGKAEAASVYRKFINSMKKKTDESQIDEACWKGYHKEGMKTMFGKKYPNCVKNKKKTNEGYQQCPECGGAMYEVSLMNEKKDACYYKVKSRYKVWPSAYASGALVKCRKKGASNWGNKSKSNEGQIYSTGGGAGQSYRYFTPKDNLGESSSILSGITQVDEGIKTKLAGAALAAAMGAFGTANAKASPATGDEFSTPIAGWSTKTDKAGNTTDRYQAGPIDMTATRNARGQPVHSGGTYRVNKTAAVNVDVPYKDGKKGITTTVGRADNPSDLDNIMGVDASAERKKLDPKAFAKFQQNYKVDEGLKSQLAGAALAAAMAAGGAQADNTRRVVPQADGTMSPSYAQQIANASQNLQVVKPLPNNFEQIVYKGMNGVRDKEDGTIVLIGNALNSVQVIRIKNNKETTDYMDIKQLGNETKQALSLIVNKSETQPLGKPTPGVTIDNQKNTLNYNGKEYDIVKIKKNGPQPRISRFDAKVQVPYPDFGIRSLGVVNVTLAGDTAYAYLD